MPPVVPHQLGPVEGWADNRGPAGRGVCCQSFVIVEEVRIKKYIKLLLILGIANAASGKVKELPFIGRIRLLK